jgi:hypothetical protein
LDIPLSTAWASHLPERNIRIRAQYDRWGGR